MLLYVRQDITSRGLKNRNLNIDIKAACVEISLRKRKWLIIASYNPKESLISNHTLLLRKMLDAYSIYDIVILLSDFNVGVDDSNLSSFCNNFNLSSLISKATCFKNPENPSCIYLILTNRPKFFCLMDTVETGPPDFQLLTFSVFRINFEKLRPTIVTYRDYSNYNNDNFRKFISEFDFDFRDYEYFISTAFTVFGKLAPSKKRYVRANEAPFMNKELDKEIMKRSRLKNKFNKAKKEEDRELYRQQRNYCKTLLNKTKKKYFEKYFEIYFQHN